MIKTLEAKIEAVVEAANKTSLKDNYFFVTTFERYCTQIHILAELKKIIDKESIIVEKEYVRGSKNSYTHPAIGEYNKTATAANGTVATLINIIKSIPEDSERCSLQDKINQLLND